jgi:N-acetylornithine carbamoyltransferase
MNHFISTENLGSAEIQRLLDQAALIKSNRTVGGLEGKNLGMIFFDPSLRTQTSFSVGMKQLGGAVTVLSVGKGVWDLEVEDSVIMDGDKAEHVREAAPVLSRYFDALAVRAFPSGCSWEKDSQDPVLNSFVRHATVPVINLESALWHPCQALGDALTWRELGLKKGGRLALTWAYHPKALPLAVPRSVVLMGVQQGLDVTVVRPPEFSLDEGLMNYAKKVASVTGGNIRESDNRDAISSGQVVYAKSWASLAAYGDHQAEQKIRQKYSDWQVTQECMELTDQAAFMHCLPVRRNVVVSDEVLDSPASKVVDQAENRLHVQKALLLDLLGCREEAR